MLLLTGCAVAAFPSVLGLDSDNGSEFTNQCLYTYCHREGITFTRSRPYKKNDSCLVELKNWSKEKDFYRLYPGGL